MGQACNHEASHRGYNHTTTLRGSTLWLFPSESLSLKCRRDFSSKWFLFVHLATHASRPSTHTTGTSSQRTALSHRLGLAHAALPHLVRSVLGMPPALRPRPTGIAPASEVESDTHFDPNPLSMTRETVEELASDGVSRISNTAWLYSQLGAHHLAWPAEHSVCLAANASLAVVGTEMQLDRSHHKNPAGSCDGSES